MHDVFIKNPGQPDRLLGTIDSLSAEFNIIETLLGYADFHDFRLVRPVLSLTRGSTGLIEWLTRGQLFKALAEARFEDGREVLDPKLDRSIGSISIEDGTVAMIDAGQSRSYKFEAVSADINWPRLSRSLNVAIVARLDASTSKPTHPPTAPSPLSRTTPPISTSPLLRRS